ncbi:glycosyltransferase [bacterium]|nr:glycosyltransferase [bacterium]
MALLGEILIDERLLTEEQLVDCLEIQKTWGTRLGDIVVARGLVRRLDMYKSLARALEIFFLEVDEADDWPDPDAFRLLDLAFMVDRRVIPFWNIEGELVLGMVDPLDDRTARDVGRLAGLPVRKAVITDLDHVKVLQTLCGSELVRAATRTLVEMDPELSALRVFSRRVLFTIGGVSLLFLASLYLWTQPALIFFFVLVNALYLVLLLFRGTLVVLGSRHEFEEAVSDEEVANLRERNLPYYTILVPVYKEAKVIPQMVRALERLDYPRSKLDVKFLFEADDVETLEAAKAAKPPGYVNLLVVPQGVPQTKPRAANWGLRFARGRIVTIFDAEDVPDADMLKKVVVAFRKSPPNILAFQASLNFYNTDDNFLTRMFTLEYAAWFDYMLPGLEALGGPIPLGGTSNHFRTDALRALGEWDPYNVTEDADLGIRAAAMGWGIRTINSTTFEEANKSLKNWITQRTRWIMGYIITYIVHMRHPIKLLRRLGLKRFLIFQAFVAGTFTIFLLNPILLLVFLGWVAGSASGIYNALPPLAVYAGSANFLIGNFIGIYMSILAVFRRRLYHLTFWALLVPIYWVLHSVAAYRALVMMVKNPYHWEKTEHGLSDLMLGDDDPEGAEGEPVDALA